MSSGCLPLGTYHRAQSLGSGSYGSVLTVYDDDGEEFALKLFVDDDDDDDEDEEGPSSSSSIYDKEDYRTMDLSALREISILRLLRDKNSHPNIVQIHDVTTDGCRDEGEGEGAGTDGYMGVAMPLFPSGNLSDAIDSAGGGGGGPLAQKGSKVQIAHGILSAVAFLHHNGIIHRDIKGDNIMLEAVEEDGSFRPVLIDFSLAKVVDPRPMYGNSSSEAAILKTMEGGFGGMQGEDTHTPAVGTPTYKAPEVVSSLPYGLPSDLYSVGVVLLELRRGKTLETSRDKNAARIVADEVERLPDQPFADLIRGLTRVDPEERWSAKRALESEVFCKFGLSSADWYRTVDIKEALPPEGDEGPSNEPEPSSPAAAAEGGKRRGIRKKGGKGVVDPVLQKRYRTIRKIAHELECEHPLTPRAALAYSVQMSRLDEEIDDPKRSQALVDCVVLAHKVFEREAWCFRSLERKVMERGVLKDCVWTVEDYRDNEGSVWLLMDFCLYPRTLLDL